jgi:two-component system nitrogen regulation response regulator GlnG
MRDGESGGRQRRLRPGDAVVESVVDGESGPVALGTPELSELKELAAFSLGGYGSRLCAEGPDEARLQARLIEALLAGAPVSPLALDAVGPVVEGVAGVAATLDGRARPLCPSAGGSSMRHVVRRLLQVAPFNFTVLIQGETGVGKELVARALHEESGRASKPFVPIDCGAIPDNLLESELFGHEKGAFSGADRRKKGLFSLAQGGTLFLDEVGNLPVGTQAKLLRVLQERKVLPLGATVPRALDVRFVAATNVPLDAAVREGRFRQDLYYRLAEFTLVVPPLRDRGGDVLLLAQRFIDDAALELGRPAPLLSSAAANLISAHAWPGNVRELRNVIRQAVLLAHNAVIDASDLVALLKTYDGPLTAPRNPGERSLKEISDAAAAEAERRAIEEALHRTGGNKSQAARLLKVDYKTLHTKAKRYGLGGGDA